MAPLVDTALADQFVPIGATASSVKTILYNLSHSGRSSDRGLFALSVCLPKSDIVGEFVGMAVKPLFSFFSAPYTDSVFYKPLHHKRGLVRNTTNAVKHEHKENIKFLLLGGLLDNLEFITVFCPHLMPGDAFLLFLMNDRPAHLFRKAVAGFPLHGNIGFILFIMVYLLIGRNTIQAPDPVSNQQIINSIIRGNLTDAIRRFTWYAVRDHTRFIHINLSSQEKMCGMRWQIDISAMKFSRYTASFLVIYIIS